MIDITDKNFKEEVLKANIPTLVDFWASWCKPCLQMATIIDNISEEYSGKLKVVKCNVDENPRLPSQYGIRAIPTLLIFKNGNVCENITGLVSVNMIVAAIDNAIKDE